MSNIFYTYAFLREDGTPYYIGKGKGDRAFRSRGRGIQPPPDKSRILILKSGLTEREAFRHEIYMIAVLGRKDLGTGILWNFTDGGEGTSGRVPSEETKERIRRGNKGKVLSEETREKMSKVRKGRKGRPLTEEHKQKLLQINLGKKQSPETRRKRSESLKGNKNGLGHAHTPERKEKISQALKGRPKSPEHKEKIRQALKRKKDG